MHRIFYLERIVLASWLTRAYDLFKEGMSTHPSARIPIRHFHIVHNALCLPPNILHKHRFQFFLGLTIVPREIENNAYAIFLGVNKVRYG